MRVYSDDTGLSLACDFLAMFLGLDIFILSMLYDVLTVFIGSFILVQVWNILSAKIVLSCIWPGLQI